MLANDDDAIYLQCVVGAGLMVNDGHGVGELLILQPEVLHGNPHQV